MTQRRRRSVPGPRVCLDPACQCLDPVSLNPVRLDPVCLDPVRLAAKGESAGKKQTADV